MSINKDLYKSLLFLLLFSLSNELIDKYNRANYNVTCSNETIGCTFKISANYPISPKIPTSIPHHAILNDYRYIYLLFNVQSKQTQKTFYLEAYDISNGETIISNGDCYFINITENSDYEIRIYKELKDNSFIQFRFLGLSQNFIMKVTLQFKLSIFLYLDDKPLSYDNSLIKSEQKFLVQYLEDFNQKLEKQIERQNMAIETIKSIMDNLFGTTININLDNDNFINSFSFQAGPFIIVTISYATGLEISTEEIFCPEENISSESMIVNGKIDLKSNGIDLMDGNINLDNNAIKIIELYKTKILDLILEFEIETDTVSLTVSTDMITNVVFTLRFYYEDTMKINYEIEIKIEFNNPDVSTKAIALSKSYEEVVSSQDLVVVGTCAFVAIVICVALPYIGVGVGLCSAALPLLPIYTNKIAQLVPVGG